MSIFAENIKHRADEGPTLSEFKQNEDLFVVPNVERSFLPAILTRKIINYRLIDNDEDARN